MDPIKLFHNLINLAAVDQKFTDEEIDYLIEVANRYNIPSEEFESGLTGIREGMIEVQLPEGEEDRQTLMKEMIKMMAVDGELNEMESDSARRLQLEWTSRHSNSTRSLKMCCESPRCSHPFW